MKHFQSCIFFKLFRLSISTFSLPVGSLLVADSTLTINQVMTPQQREQMGLDRATQAQQQAFEQWITGWTYQVIDQAPSYHASQTLPQWVASWPAYANPHSNPNSQAAIRSKRVTNAQIFRNFNGEELELKDGSKWKIVPWDIVVVQYWQRGDAIAIEPSGDLHFPFKLFDDTQGKQANAQQIQRPSPSGQRQPDPPSYFAGSVLFQHASADGSKLLMQTGKRWNVAPEDQFKTATWRTKDRIKIENNGDMLYGYTLTNLDSGEIARAEADK